MQEEEIKTAIRRAQEGISQYQKIMEKVHRVNVAEDRDFQRQFNHFYRIRQRSEQWYAEYYSFMEERKSLPPKFDETLDHFCKKLKRYEPSFSSKLAATLDPMEPVWDQYVIQNTGQIAPAYSSPLGTKVQRAKTIYQRIREWYLRRIQSPEGELMIDVFDELVAQHEHITPVKKIDFILWQTRA